MQRIEVRTLGADFGKEAVQLAHAGRTPGEYGRNRPLEPFGLVPEAIGEQRAKELDQIRTRRSLDIEATVTGARYSYSTGNETWTNWSLVNFAINFY